MDWVELIVGLVGVLVALAALVIAWSAFLYAAEAQEVGLLVTVGRTERRDDGTRRWYCGIDSRYGATVIFEGINVVADTLPYGPPEAWGGTLREGQALQGGESRAVWIDLPEAITAFSVDIVYRYDLPWYYRNSRRRLRWNNDHRLVLPPSESE